MQLPHPLDDVFASRSHVRLLRALDELPDGLPVSARELGRRSGLSHPTASRVLGSLVDQRLVLARRGLRSDGFELNRRHVLVEKLRPIFESERRLLQELMVFMAEAIERLAPGVAAAYLFGSVVRGEMTSSSDIDLAVTVLAPNEIAETESHLDAIADAVRERFGNRLNITIGPSLIDQLRQPSRPGHRFWARVAREGITVIDRRKSHELRTKRSRSA
jgi:predicted nucleotidyltransferase